MSRRSDSVEKEFADLSVQEQAVYSTYGKSGLESWRAGVFDIVKDFSSADRLSSGTAAIVKLMLEAVRTKSGSKLRHLANAVEVLNKHELHDPALHVALGAKYMLPMRKTAHEVQADLVRIAGKNVPDIKTIRRKFRAVKSPLLPARRGPTKGLHSKSLHRARK